MFPRLTFMAWSTADLARLTDGVERMLAASRELQADVQRHSDNNSAMMQLVASLADQVKQLREENQKRSTRARKANATRNGTGKTVPTRATVDPAVAEFIRNAAYDPDIETEEEAAARQRGEQP
jgi:uncharacterized protein YoxC